MSAAGDPQWQYLDCMVANGAIDGESPYFTTVREWRDRQVAWEILNRRLVCGDRSVWLRGRSVR